ncbi:DUF4129 domain-containing protein [Anaerolineae bacterium CFX7]|nr:DUF4129 domain-containing protein [Anaerolineae bacterium CFX7]
MKKYLGLLALALICLWHPAPARADTPTTLDEYRAAVAQTFDLVTRAAAQEPGERAALLNQAASVLEAIDAVTLPSGAEIPVNNRALIALIRDAEKTQAAQTRLAALRDALAQPLAPIATADLTLLENILNHPPFVAESSALPSWLQDILLRIERYLDRLFNQTARGIFDTRDLIVLFGIGLVVAVLFYFLRGLRRNFVKAEALPSLPQAREVRTPNEALSNAQQFANQGDYRNAVRQLYLATLLLLDQRGKIKYDPTLTNREYLRQTSNDPRATAALAPIVETFDRAWYGFENITPTEFDAYRARVEQVKEL